MRKTNGGSKVRKGKTCKTCGRDVTRDSAAVELVDGSFVCSRCEENAYWDMMDSDSQE